MIALQMTFPAPGDTVLRDLARLSPEVPKAIKRGLDFGMQLVVGRIQLDQLSGQGPFPPSEHRLGTRTGQLRDALRANPAVISGDSVSVEIVNPVLYAGVHEYGMTIYPKNRKFLSFQIDGVWHRAKKVTIPERSPVRYGLTRNAPVLSEAVIDEVSVTVDKLLGNKK
jgi:hypothetical protein